MKKVLILVAICLMFSANAYADETDNTTDGAGSALKLAALSIGVSPGVFAHYENDLNTNAQWFAVATAHEGGTKMFGAAQNNSGTFYIEAGTNTITGPLTAGTTYTLPTKDQAVSDTYWSDSNWTR